MSGKLGYPRTFHSRVSQAVRRIIQVWHELCIRGMTADEGIKIEF